MQNVLVHDSELVRKLGQGRGLAHLAKQSDTHEDLGSSPSPGPQAVVWWQTPGPSARGRGRGIGGLPGSPFATWRVGGQPGLHTTLSQNKTTSWASGRVQAHTLSQPLLPGRASLEQCRSASIEG